MGITSPVGLIDHQGATTLDIGAAMGVDSGTPFQVPTETATMGEGVIES